MHPILYLIAEFVLTVLIIGFTQAYSPLRSAGLLLITLCVIKCIPSCMSYMVRTPWAALLGGYSATYLYHYLDIALLSCWSFEHNAPVSGLIRPTITATARQKGSTPSISPSAWERLKFGIKLTSTFRFVGTSYEARNTPEATKKNPRDFCRRKFVTIVLSYVILDFIQAQNDPDIAARFLGLENIPVFTRFNEFTVEEGIIRMFTVLAAGIALVCVQGGVYRTLALLAVSLGISEPVDWPPFFGSLWEAYTLRRFWE